MISSVVMMDFLGRGPHFASDNDCKLYTYVMRHDAGLAPNPFWGWCTLAVCTPNHQGSRVEPGDWIAGFQDKSRGYRLVYAMEVAERIHMMRHFLRPACPPPALACRVATGAPVAQLVAGAGPAQRLAPALARAPCGAILVAAVAAPADAHLPCAPPATEQPIAWFALPHAARTQRWTTPRNAGIRKAQTRPCAARAC
ncbi:MAG: hypothetical protein IT529_04575 [Burkholderiales bacterium]|nr:hypothetical protein [Burkholderiales bacterium]